MTQLRSGWLGALAVVSLSATAGAQQAGQPAGTPEAPVNSPAGGVYVPPPAQAPDPNAGLSQSSRARGPGESDTFDFDRSGGASPVLRGSEGAPGVVSRAMRVPDVYTVERGDTLWGLCDRFYGDPYQWPRVWSYNAQLQNPHWIYPGDELRLRGSSDGAAEAMSEGHFSAPRSLVPRRTVFLRDQGYLDDFKRDTLGQVVGSREEQALLSDGNRIYMSIKEGVDLEEGMRLTIFKPVRRPERVSGARRPPGEIVKVLGTVRIDQWDAKRRIARGEIIESIDVIERGALLGNVGRRFDVVPPRKATKDVWARVLTSLYPNVFVAQNQVVFIDRGSEDGIEPGHRLFVVRRGDTWRRSLRSASGMARDRLRMDDPNQVSVETTPTPRSDDDFPEEIVGELRVLRTRKKSSLALITASDRELEAGDRAVMKQGY